MSGVISRANVGRPTFAHDQWNNDVGNRYISGVGVKTWMKNIPEAHCLKKKNDGVPYHVCKANGGNASPDLLICSGFVRRSIDWTEGIEEKKKAGIMGYNITCARRNCALRTWPNVNSAITQVVVHRGSEWTPNVEVRYPQGDLMW